MWWAILLFFHLAFGQPKPDASAVAQITPLFESEIESQILSQNIDRLQRQGTTNIQLEKLGRLKTKFSKLQAANHSAKVSAAYLAAEQSLEPTRGTFTKRWRYNYQVVNLQKNHFDNLPNNDREMQVYYDRSESNDFHLLFRSQFKSRTLKTRNSDGETKITHQPLSATLSCDESVDVKTALFFRRLKAGKNKSLRIFYSAEDGARLKIKILKTGTQCLLNWVDKEITYRVLIRDEKLQLPLQEKFKSQFEICPLPGQTSSPLETIFFSSKYRSMGCPFPLTSHKFLDKKNDGLLAKAEALLGQMLPDEMLSTTNPYYPLDFSQAPQLSGIYISYLVWRSDFSGTILNRLVRYHASKGVPVKIMISKVISLKKDKVALRKLAADFPNVQVKLYKYNESQLPSLRDAIGQLHRTNHIKLFIVKHEKKQADNDMVFIGGRNIHDGFMFDKTPDISRFPELVQYGEDEGKALWTDFEIQLKDSKWVDSVTSQFFAAWNYDRKRYIFRGYSYPVVDTEARASEWLNTAGSSGLIRHFTSAPHSDDMSLERLYVQLIDAAQKKINLSTPYFNLTQDIANAFRRAVDRGVEVDVITRLNLDGDTAGNLLADVNKTQVNALRNEASISAFALPTNERDILHSKLIVIDETLTVIGSVNLNNRSFYHDLENCTLIWSPRISQEVTDLLAQYRSTSQLVDKKQKIGWLNKVLIWAIDKEL